MSRYVFSRAERYAVFTAHREVCWICGQQVGIEDMHVDHLVPEHLDGTPELEEVKRDLGLPSEFKVNGFENWVPAHPRCNRTKGAHIYRPTPLIQRLLDQAASKAEDAIRLRDTFASDRQ